MVGVGYSTPRLTAKLVENEGGSEQGVYNGSLVARGDWQGWKKAQARIGVYQRLLIVFIVWRYLYLVICSPDQI